MQTVRDEILDVLLQYAAFEGWNHVTLTRAAKDAGYDAFALDRAFGDGVSDVMWYFSTREDERMEASILLDTAFPSRKVREKITYLVRFRIESLAPHREAVRGAIAHIALPPSTIPIGRMIWNTVDRMWRLAGDVSTDMNWYSKRILLYKVYISTLLFWLNDSSKDYQATWEFLDRRVQGVLAFGGMLQKIKTQIFTS